MTNKSEQKKGPIAWMVNNPVAANLLMLFFLLGGLLSTTRIKQEVFPDISLDTVTVSVAYPGASPEEVEKGIILATEEALRGIDGIKELRSTASEGFGTVVAELYENADYTKTYQDIKSEIDRITTYPKDSEKPVTTLDTTKRGVLSVIIFGDTDEKSLREIAEKARDFLIEDEEITQIDLVGARDLEIKIEVPIDTLRRHSLSIGDIKTAVQNSSLELPGGIIKTRAGEILLRVKERKDFAKEFEKIPVVSKKDGTRLLLSDIAKISDDFDESDRYAVFNGKPAIMLSVYRVGNQTPITVSNAVKKRVEALRTELSPQIDLKILDDRADIYRQRLNLMLKNGAFGVILVLFLLGIFLEIKLAFWVLLGIPVSFLGAFIFMPVLGLSINMVTMFAMILALGILVDDAIVVGENIYSLHENGVPLADAAIAGTSQVISPVSFSILTNMAAMLPLAFLPGIMGKILWMLPAIVCLAFAVSWVESLFILPAHIAHQSTKPKHGLNAFIHNLQQKFSRFYMNCVKNIYGPFLRFTVQNRYAVLLIALAIFAIVFAFVRSGRMGFELFPRIESDYAYVSVKLPFGANVEKTKNIEKQLRKAAEKVIREIGHPEICEGIFSDIGKGGANNLEIFVYLVSPEARKKFLGKELGTQIFTEKWREAVGEILGIESISFQSDRGGPGAGAALTIELKHKSMETLKIAGEELASALENFQIVKDIDDGFQVGKMQYDFKVTPKGEALGVTPAFLARTLRDYYEGAEAVRQQRGRNEIKIKVRRSQKERISEDDLKNLIIKTPSSAEAPLSEIAQIEEGRSYTKITRKNGKRTIEVTADVSPRYKTVEIINAIEKDTMPSLLEKYPGLEYSYEGRQADSRDSFGKLQIFIPVVLLFIYTMLAIPFGSYIQPIVIMVSIPLGFVGAVAGHFLMGYKLSLMSVIGILALSGVVVNDAIVMLDFANIKRREENLSALDAIIAAGIQRFRPIMLTTLTTLGGLSSMIFETSRQARFLIPMAISLGYGLLFATLITLVLIPSLYLIVEDIKKLFSTERLS